MIRAYGLLAAAALLVNGPAMAPLIAVYQRATSDDRPSPPPAFAPAAFGVEAEKGRDGLFRLTGRANRRVVRFVVDTGATVTVLSARDAARLGLSSPGRSGESGTLRTAGGATAMAWRSLAHLDIAGGHFTDVDVVVVRGGPDHSLLGQDVLSRLGTITMTSGRLAIRRPAA